MTYPKRTVAAVGAVVGGSVAAALIFTAVATNGYFENLFAQNARVNNIVATSTGDAVSSSGTVRTVDLETIDDVLVGDDLTVTDDAVITGDLQVIGTCTGCGGGGGAYVGQGFVASTTFSVDYGTQSTSQCADTAVTVTGTAVGDYVYLSVPAGLYSWNGHLFQAYVASSDTVNIRRCNVRQSTSSDPAPATFTIEVRR